MSCYDGRVFTQGVCRQRALAPALSRRERKLGLGIALATAAPAFVVRAALHNAFAPAFWPSYAVIRRNVSDVSLISKIWNR